MGEYLVKINVICLDPELDAGSRIHILQKQLSDLRKTYMELKAEVASIDRRRKKLKKKEKEAAEKEKEKAKQQHQNQQLQQKEVESWY